MTSTKVKIPKHLDLRKSHKSRQLAQKTYRERKAHLMKTGVISRPNPKNRKWSTITVSHLTDKKLKLVYDDTTQACKSLGISRSTLTRNINTGNPTRDGYIIRGLTY